MKKIAILFLFILIDALSAARLIRNALQYTEGDNVKISFSKMEAQNKDWIGIYPINSNNSWKHVIAWKWTGDKDSGTINFENLPKGKYEARVFYNNTYKSEAAVPFEIEALKNYPKVKLHGNKSFSIRYHRSAPIKNRDWIGVYKKGTSNSWGNVIQWKWVKDLVCDNSVDPSYTYIDFSDQLPKGEYEIRFFRDNSFNLHSKREFNTNNSIIFKQSAPKFISFQYRKGTKIDKLDWMAIYKHDDSNAFENVIKWAWVKDLEKNEFHADLDPFVPFGYEIRFFRNNSFKLDSSSNFEPLYDF